VLTRQHMLSLRQPRGGRYGAGEGISLMLFSYTRSELLVCRANNEQSCGWSCELRVFCRYLNSCYRLAQLERVRRFLC
jgi:hypothetical protein